jgi:hypothetical protein
LLREHYQAKDVLVQQQKVARAEALASSHRALPQLSGNLKRTHEDCAGVAGFTSASDNARQDQKGKR